MKKKLFVFITLVLIVGGVLVWYLVMPLHNNGTGSVTVREEVFSVTLADTDRSRAKGLGGVTSLGDREGMLFVFDAPGVYQFWMKDMLIPIDMLWINSKQQIVHIEHAVTPDSYPKTFGSGVVAQYVLEVPAGTAQELDIKIGDTLSFVL